MRHLTYITSVLMLTLDNRYCKAVDNTAEELITLLEIANRTCDVINWCFISIEYVYKDERDYSKVSYCPSCSCGPGCYNDMKCCPDKTLSEIYNMTPFKDVDDYISFLSTLDNKTIVIEDLNWKYYLNQTNNVLNSDKSKCIYSGILGMSPYRSIKDSYEMIAKCAIASVGQDTKEKCESINTSTTFANLKEMIPVQSRNSLMIYKNIHCFQCSDEAGSEFDMWDIYYSCSNGVPSFIHYHVDCIEDILYHVMKFADGTRSYPCNLHLKPKPHFSENTKKCFDSDVDECGQNSSDTILRKTCEYFYNPVYLATGNKVTVFNNLACLACNGYNISAVRGAILERSGHDFIGKIDVVRTDLKTLNESTMFNDIHDHGKLIATRFSAECKEGHIYDAEMAVCRQVLCPCGMVVRNGECWTILSELLNQPYQIYISIAVGNGFSDETMMKEFENQIGVYFKLKLGFSNFEVKELQLYRSNEIKIQNIYYLALITFCSKGNISSFPDTILMVNSFLGNKQIALLGHTFTFNIKVTNTITFQPKSAIDAVNNKEYTLIYSEVTAKFLNQQRVRIGECAFCYRVELMHEDFIRVKGRIIRIKRNKKYAAITNESRMLSHRSRFVVCLSLLFQNTNNSNIYSPTTSNENSDKNSFLEKNIPDETAFSINEEKTVDLSREMPFSVGKGITVIYVGAGLLFVLFTLTIIRRYKIAIARRQHNGDINNQNNTSF